MKRILLFVFILTTSGAGGQSPRRMDSVFASKVNKALEIIPNLAISLDKQSKALEKQAIITDRLYNRALELRVQNDTLRSLFIAAEVERVKYQELNRQLLNKMVLASEQAQLTRDTDRAFDWSIGGMVFLILVMRIYVAIQAKKMPLKYVG